MSDAGSVSRWLDGLKAGDDADIRRLWDRYFQRLVQLAGARARPLSLEAERRFSELVAADPESVDAQLQLAHAQIRLARKERDDAQPARAMAVFRQALGRLNRLEGDGRIEDRPSCNPQALNALRREAAAYEAASTRPPPGPAAPTPMP